MIFLVDSNIKKFPNFYNCTLNIPIVEEVIDESRPSTQENGRDIAIALVPIFPTCTQINISPRTFNYYLTELDVEWLILPVAVQENKSRQAC